jgi:hypothetical protein
MDKTLPRFRRVEGTENEVELVKMLDRHTPGVPDSYEQFLWDAELNRYRKYVYQGDELVECIE